MNTYAAMVNLLMGAPLNVPEIDKSNWNVNRLIQNNSHRPNHIKRFYGLRQMGWRVVSFVYDQLHLPFWVWKNVCHGDDETTFLTRLGYMTQQFFKFKNFQKIIGAK
jgi:hypothetical protein